MSDGASLEFQCAFGAWADDAGEVGAPLVMIMIVHMFFVVGRSHLPKMAGLASLRSQSKICDEGDGKKRRRRASQDEAAMASDELEGIRSAFRQILDGDSISPVALQPQPVSLPVQVESSDVYPTREVRNPIYLGTGGGEFQPSAGHSSLTLVLVAAVCIAVGIGIMLLFSDSQSAKDAPPRSPSSSSSHDDDDVEAFRRAMLASSKSSSSNSHSSLEEEEDEDEELVKIDRKAEKMRASSSHLATRDTLRKEPSMESRSDKQVAAEDPMFQKLNREVGARQSQMMR